MRISATSRKPISRTRSFFTFDFHMKYEISQDLWAQIVGKRLQPNPHCQNLHLETNNLGPQTHRCPSLRQLTSAVRWSHLLVFLAAPECIPPEMHESLESTYFRLFRCVIGRLISILTGSTAPTLHDNQDNVCVCASISSMRNKYLPPGRGLSFVQVFFRLWPLFLLLSLLWFSLFSSLSSLLLSLLFPFLTSTCFFVVSISQTSLHTTEEFDELTHHSIYLFFTPSLFGIFLPILCHRHMYCAGWYAGPFHFFSELLWHIAFIGFFVKLFQPENGIQGRIGIWRKESNSSWPRMEKRLKHKSNFLDSAVQDHIYGQKVVMV